jgi:hypothetical protein
MRWLEINGQVFIVKHLARGRADRSHYKFFEPGTNFINNAQFIGQFQQVDDLVARREHGDVDLARRNSSNVLLERSAIFGQRPIVNAYRIDCRAARL